MKYQASNEVWDIFFGKSAGSVTVVGRVLLFPFFMFIYTFWLVCDFIFITCESAFIKGGKKNG